MSRTAMLGFDDLTPTYVKVQVADFNEWFDKLTMNENKHRSP